MLSLSVFLDGCCWLYYSVLLNDVDVGIVSQHHCCHYLSLRLSLLARTVGCHVYCWLLNCTSRSCTVVAYIHTTGTVAQVWPTGSRAAVALYYLCTVASSLSIIKIKIKLYIVNSQRCRCILWYRIVLVRTKHFCPLLLLTLFCQILKYVNFDVLQKFLGVLEHTPFSTGRVHHSKICCFRRILEVLFSTYFRSNVPWDSGSILKGKTVTFGKQNDNQNLLKYVENNLFQNQFLEYIHFNLVQKVRVNNVLILL